jgi:hypothetical protein
MRRSGIKTEPSRSWARRLRSCRTASCRYSRIRK